MCPLFSKMCSLLTNIKCFPNFLNTYDLHIQLSGSLLPKTTLLKILVTNSKQPLPPALNISTITSVDPLTIALFSCLRSVSNFEFNHRYWTFRHNLLAYSSHPSTFACDSFKCSYIHPVTFPTTFLSFMQFTPEIWCLSFCLCFAIRDNLQPLPLISTFSIASIDVWYTPAARTLNNLFLFLSNPLYLSLLLLFEYLTNYPSV